MKSIMQFLLKRINGTIGSVILVAALLAALWGVAAPPFDPIALDFSKRLLPPSPEHIFGTDQFGRDVFSRILAATSVSLLVSFLSVLCAAIAGVLIGAIVGYLSGWTDRVAMTVMDSILALPSLLLALAILSVLGPGKFGVVLALGIAYTPKIARVIRGTVLSLRQQEFVDASRVMGNSDFYTVARHIIPNCISPAIVLCTTFFALALLAESALSFLGLGVPPPYPSLGGMLADSRSFLPVAPWLSIYPGIAIALLLLGFNLLGDALRDIFDPRMAGV